MTTVELLQRVTTELNGGIASLAAISNYHANTLRGRAFSAKVENAALAAGASLYFEIISPASDLVVHLKNLLVYTDQASGLSVSIIEAPTLTDGTTPIVKLNRNRNSALVSGITLYSDPTGISGGTELSGVPYQEAGPQSTTLVQSDEEWELKKNAKTLISITNEHGTAASMWAFMYWYEEPA